MTRQGALVLIVDDDQDFLQMTRDVLQAGGYRVVCAHDAEAALAAMTKEEPELVITDLTMQTMGAGFSLSRKIKEAPHRRDVPVIIVTAAGARLGYDFIPRNPQDLAAMHADAFFEKPVPPGRLLARMAHLLHPDVEEER